MLLFMDWEERNGKCVFSEGVFQIPKVNFCGNCTVSIVGNCTVSIVQSVM